MEYKTLFVSTSTRLVKYLDQKRQDQKSLQSFEITATFTAIIFFIIFAIKPAIVTITGLAAEINATQAASEKLRAKINQIVAAQDIFSQVQEKYSIIESSLPTRARYANIALQAEGIGQSFGIAVPSLLFTIPGEDQKNSIQKKIKINMGQETSFANGLEVVNQLKNNRRLIKINGVTFSANQNASASAKVTFSVSTDVLFWDQPTN